MFRKLTENPFLLCKIGQFKSKSILALVFLTTIKLLSVASDAGAAGCDFTASGDATVNNILSGSSTGKSCPSATLSAQLLAIVGICPNSALSQAQTACANQPQSNRDACQKFYMGAYYGKLQAACHYLVNVQQANANYKAPPPLSGLTTP